MQTRIHFIILIWILKMPAASLKVMTANVRVTKWNCTNHGLRSCSGYNLKIGYTRSPECVLSTDSIFSFAQNRNQETFPLSSRNGTTFTYIPKSTSNARLIVLVLDNRDNFKATSCEDLHRRHEQGNTTLIHSDSYFVIGSAKYSFDIEIVTVCSSTLCTGLLCNHCVTKTEQTSEPSRTTPPTTPITTTSPTLTKIQRTTKAVIAHNNAGVIPGTIVTRVALIVVIIALIVVLVIFLYKWWSRNNKVIHLNTSSKIKKKLSVYCEQKEEDKEKKHGKDNENNLMGDQIEHHNEKSKQSVDKKVDFPVDNKNDESIEERSQSVCDESAVTIYVASTC